MEKIRILWVSENSIHNRNLLSKMDYDRFEIHHVSFDTSMDLDYMGSSTCFPRSPLKGQLGTIWTKRKDLLRLSREINPHIIYGSYVIGHAFGAFLAKGSHQKLIVTAHGSDLLLRRRLYLLDEIIKRLVIKKADLVHTVSRQLSGSACTLGADINKIREFPIGVDVDFFVPLDRAKKKTKTLQLYTNRWHRAVYNNETILGALKLLYRDGFKHFRLIMAGSGPLTERYKRFVDQVGLENHVEFVGTVGAEENLRYLNSSHLFISASASDGTSSSLIEAMACGVFPIVSRIPANIPWIAPGNGYLFRYDSPEELKGCIQKYLHNNYDNNYIWNNRKKVVNSGNLDSAVKNFHSMFIKLSD